MKMPIARKPISRSTSAPVATVAKQTKGGVPTEVITAVLKTEENRIAKTYAEKIYTENRATVAAYMAENKVESLTVVGEVAGSSRTVSVTYGDTSKNTASLVKLLAKSKLSLKQLYDMGLLSVTAKAIEDKLGKQLATECLVAGNPNYNASTSSKING
ncbi:MAG: hypothetical protein ABW007_18945 [Chitinophagaceae bacterium]